MDYTAYLDVFSQPCKIANSRRLKFKRQYREYLQKLLEYLSHFIERTEPLQDIDRMFSKVTAEFEEEWASESGRVEGWENNRHVPVEHTHTVIDLDYYSSVEELMEAGPERLKEALAALGLKAGLRRHS